MIYNRDINIYNYIFKYKLVLMEFYLMENNFT